MAFRLCPEHELLYDQLRWIERRRIRVQDSVGSHFGRAEVEKLVESIGQPLRLYTAKPLGSIVDEREPENFLRKLAFEIEKQEATLFQTFLEKLSPYPEHVAEQVFFGARCAGQEAGRTYLSKNKRLISEPPLPLNEMLAAVDSLFFNGFPNDRHFFTAVRPLIDVLIHYKSCPHLPAWHAAGADTAFMADMQKNWIDGVLDVLAKNIMHYHSASLAKGDAYGKEHFVYREKYAPWP